MDAIKAQLLRIQQQLAGLSASQKMLTASLVVIMIMTMFYWSRYAGTSEMDVLLDQSLSPDEISQIKTALASKGIKYEVTGDRILVPADRKFEAIADLGFMQLLPRDMKSGFDEIVDKMSPLDSESKSSQMWNRARERSLSMIISRWPGVKNAMVMIDGAKKLSPVRPVEPTASVDVTLKPGEEPSKHLGEAVVNLVHGAQAGLKRENIRVNINGRPYKAPDPNNPFSGSDGSILEQQANWEEYYKRKIAEQIQYVPGVYATVSVELKTSTDIINQKTVDPKNTVSVPTQETTQTEENMQSAPAGEPGVATNVGIMSIDQGNGPQTPGQHSSREKTEVRNAVDWGMTHKTTQTPAGLGTAVAAALRVPESYFRTMWKVRNPNAQTEPTEAELEALVQKETPRLREDVKKATNIKDDAAVSVAMYVDVMPPAHSGDAAATGGLASMPLGVGFGAKEIAIGALAVISLFMVSMMVRKSAPQPSLPPLQPTPAADDDESGAPGDVTVASDIAGEVGTAGMLLTGREMSEEQIESQQVIEQVGTMVKENPDVAANLVKRWLNRD